MEQLLLTKRTSEVYFAAPDAGHEPILERRHVPIVNAFEQRPLKVLNYPLLKATSESLVSLYREAWFEKYRRLGKQAPEDSVNNETDQSTRKLSSYKDKINRKREHIEACLRCQTSPNFAAVARMTRCHRSTVKRVYEDLVRQDHASLYQYNNLKSPEQEAQLAEAIEGIERTFKTVSDLRRLLPGFSKKYVLRGLKSRGYRFRKVPKLKAPNKQKRNPDRILKTIQHITMAHTAPDPGMMLFVDEMKFPLTQSAYRHWMHPGLHDPTLKNIRGHREQDKRHIIAMAMCSKLGFVAVQFCDENEINAHTFVYFLIKAVERLPPRNYYTILADNATWHNSKFVGKTEVSKFLFLNISMLFQVNMIENAFSFMRATFRKRPFFDTVEEEITYLARTFFDPSNDKRFEGIYRNHLRTLTKYLDQYWPLTERY